MEQQELKIIIKGKVQGVWFRKSTQITASRLGVCGFVHNNPDGSVEVYAIGDPEQVTVFVGWLHSGPPFARVKSVDISDITLMEKFHQFLIR